MGCHLDSLHVAASRPRKLLPVQIPVKRARLQQLSVRPRCQDAAILQHHDLVRVLDGREAVGDDECGAVVHQGVQRALNLAFGVGVQRGRGLVQDEDAGVLEKGARDGNALTLPAGEPRSPTKLANAHIFKPQLWRRADWCCYLTCCINEATGDNK